MNFNKQDRHSFVTLSEPLALSEANGAAKGLARWIARCFAALSMTVSVVVGKIHKGC